jgi:acyl-CoA synthetase (AMP-forming)/AMP-acid ligase II
MFVYTSGTEAFPKGVMIPHRNYLLGTTPAWVAHMDIRPEDTWLFVMPFFTMAGLGSMTNLTLVGATLVMPYAIDPAGALRLLRDEGVTTMAQTPTFFLAVARQGDFADDPPMALRRCITYGGMVPGSMLDAWRAVLPELVWGTFWSQSELSQLGTVGWFCTLDDIPGRDPSWIGKAMAGLELRVVDDDGNDAGEGHVICRSPAVMLGYHDDPDRTAEVFRDGWLHTGDVMRIDTDGNLFFLDRAKDMIKSGGMNVSSVEVERILSAHPAVERAAVVGVADDYWSEAVNAFVVPRPGETPHAEDLIAWTRERAAPYKVPKAIHLVDQLPVDGQGKVLKRELRQQVTPG